MIDARVIDILGAIIFYGSLLLIGYAVGYIRGWCRGYETSMKDSGVITGKSAVRFNEKIKTNND